MLLQWTAYQGEGWGNGGNGGERLQMGPAGLRVCVRERERERERENEREREYERECKVGEGQDGKIVIRERE